MLLTSYLTFKHLSQRNYGMGIGIHIYIENMLQYELVIRAKSWKQSSSGVEPINVRDI